MSSMNMEDPGKQEAIRRGHHEYLPTAGKHGTYVSKQYRHQEYPKMIGKFPQPVTKDFPGLDGGQRFEAALRDWDRAMQLSVVNSKAEEAQWLKENG
jgi:hypothetical protein